MFSPSVKYTLTNQNSLKTIEKEKRDKDCEESPKIKSKLVHQGF